MPNEKPRHQAGVFAVGPSPVPGQYFRESGRQGVGAVSRLSHPPMREGWEYSAFHCA